MQQEKILDSARVFILASVLFTYYSSRYEFVFLSERVKNFRHMQDFQNLIKFRIDVMSYAINYPKFI